MKDIDLILKSEGYLFNCKTLKEYFQLSVPARERAKLAFSKGLSDSLLIIKKWGEKNNLDLDGLSYLKISEIFSKGEDIPKLKKIISIRRKMQVNKELLHFPNLISEPGNLDIVLFPDGSPTFITSKIVSGNLINISKGNADSIKNSIVFIEGADPGFDWIFTKNILGLITNFGGANSHIAIRCAEFGLPAVIGCGSKISSKLIFGKPVELNCKARTVKSLEPT